MVLTQRSETKRKAYFRYIETGYYMTRWLLGPAPWEEDTAYKAVNEYHIRAALSFRDIGRSLELIRKSQVWIFAQLIFGPCWPKNQLNKNQNIA